MLHAVALTAIAGLLPGFLPAQGGPPAASARVILDEVCMGGPHIVDGAQSRVVFTPQTLPGTSLSTGRLEAQAPPPVAWVSGAGAVKALPSSSTTLPVGDRAIVAVSTEDECVPGGGAHPWRPG